MVDSTAGRYSLDVSASSRGTEVTGIAAGISFRVEKADGAKLADYEEFVSKAVAGVPQRAIWIRSWIEATAADAVIFTMLDNGRPALALALETARWGRMTIARFVGGTHANANFAAIVPGYRPPAAVLRKGLTHALKEARPDIDALFLERQIDVLDGTSNPLLELSSLESANIGLEVSLENGFDGILAKHNAKRRLKKNRYQQRKFEEAGGFRVIAARSPEEVRRLLDAFLDMKATWFRDHGVKDVFSDTATRGFFEKLFLRALDEEDPTFFLDGLEVDGRLRAITGSSRDRGREVCQFGTIADDELTPFSPGEYLAFQNISRACAEGVLVYDYGVGDEPYKRMWCDQEIHHFDTVLGLTLKGKIVAATRSASTFLKRQVKSRPALYDLVKRLRRRRASLSSPER